jgi:Tfp pilus assembly protein PilX
MTEIGKEYLKRRNEEKGFVLIVGLLVMTVLLLLAVPFLYQLSFENRLTVKSYKSSAALSLAEAGVERAIWELNYGDISTWDGDSSLRTMTISSFQTPDGNVIGDIEIRVEAPDGDNPVVSSSGRVALVESRVLYKCARVVLEEEKYKPWTNGIFGDEELDFSSNAIVDSYDSRNGAYGGSNMGSEGHVGTNGTHYGCIDLDPNARIYGNALSGPETIPEDVIITWGNAEIFGELDSLSEPNAMPSVPLPESLLYSGDYSLGGTDSDTIDESGVYTSFRLDSNCMVTITADVTLFITGEFAMRSNSQLEIADGIKVTIYLGGSFIQHSNTQINNLSEDPTSLLMLGTDTFNGDMEWNSNSQFLGSVYVPKADVHLNSNADFYGSISGKSFECDSNSKIHYDLALAALELDGADGTPYTVKSWQEVIPATF